VQALGDEAIAQAFRGRSQEPPWQCGQEGQADARFKALETLIQEKKDGRLVISPSTSPRTTTCAAPIARFGDGDWLRACTAA
jgi:hypothetical protein